jgi:hypothetical protein
VGTFNVAIKRIGALYGSACYSQVSSKSTILNLKPLLFSEKLGHKCLILWVIFNALVILDTVFHISCMAFAKKWQIRCLIDP